MDDTVVEGAHTGKLTFAVASNDALFNGKPVTDLSVAITDDDMLLVEEVVINDGDVQRSMITEVKVQFNAKVTLGASAFALIKRDTGSGIPIGTTFTSTEDVDGKTVATIRFKLGTSVVERDNGLHSLADGNYQLTINAAQININGMLLDGDGDDTAGGNHVFGNVAEDEFFRLFGDIDGIDGVDGDDLYLRLLPAYGANDGDPAYRPELDWDGIDGIDGDDLYLRFLPNYGKVRDLSGF